MAQEKLLGVVKRPGASAEVIMVSPELHGMQGVLGCRYIEYVHTGSIHLWCDEEAKLKQRPEMDGKPSPWVNIRNPNNPEGDVILGNVLALGIDDDGESISLTAAMAADVIIAFETLALSESDFTSSELDRIIKPSIEIADFAEIAKTHPIMCTCISCGFAQ